MADPRDWLTLAFVGAPALWLVAAVLVSETGGSSLLPVQLPTRVVVGLIFVGAATAGLAPLDRWRQNALRYAGAAYLSEGYLPIVGWSLAARGFAAGAVRPDRIPLAVLVALGAWGVASTVWSVWRGHGSILRGSADRSLGFLALALPVGTAAAGVGLLVIVVGALVRLVRPAWLRRRSERTGPEGPIDSGPIALAPRVTGSGDRVRGTRGARSWRLIFLDEPVRAIEDRYDLAVGLLVAVAVLFVFGG